MNRKRLICLFLCLLLLMPLTVRAMSGPDVSAELNTLLGAKPETIPNTDKARPGESNADWAALVAARNGYDRGREDYLQGLWDYVSQQYAAIGGLDTIKATQWHRISLTLLALGADPTSFGQDSEGNPIDLIADGTYAWHMTDSLGTQGANAWIYALLVLDAGAYAVPEDASYTRQGIIREILACQTEDGGFTMTGGASDVDMTAMALQALAPYYETDEMVHQRVDAALGYLSQTQNARGDFADGGSESCAQVILALCALGIDPETDSRFVKQGGSALDGLLLYSHRDGGFSHTADGGPAALSTQQAAQALTALDRLRSGMGRLYDFTDTDREVYTPRSNTILWIGSGLLLLAAVGILWIRKGKRECTR